MFFFMTIQIGQDSPGKCIPVKCDHGSDEEVKELFDKVSKEQNGRLDVLVNNAYAGVQVSHLFYLCPRAPRTYHRYLISLHNE